MPSPESQSSRAFAKKMLNPTNDEALDEQIIKTLEDVPAGVLRALYRHGVTIRAQRGDATSWVFDKGACRIILHPDRETELPYQLMRLLGYAFNEMLSTDYVQQKAGAGTLHRRLSDLAIRSNGHGDADRLLDCWHNGDTLTLDATKSPADMFADGFAHFCIPELRQQLDLRAPGLFELLTEFVGRYKHGAPQPPLQNIPDGGPDIKQARKFAANMLLGSPSSNERERVAQCLQYAPVAVLRLLQRHGIHISLKGTSANCKKGGSEYVPGSRCVYLTHISSSILMHELGHALDHALFLESAEHDPEVQASPSRSERALCPEAVEFFTQLGWLFPGRYPLADSLAERWQRVRKVSDYAGTDIVEWFAESFKCSRNTGEKDDLSLGFFKFGDGTRATLVAYDPQFMPNLDRIMRQLRDDVNITRLPVVKDESSLRYTQDHTVKPSERFTVDAVRASRNNVKVALVLGVLLLGLFTAVGWLVAGGAGAAIAFAATLAAKAACDVFILHFFGSGHLRTAEVIGRIGTDCIVAKDAKGTIIAVDCHLFAPLARAPEQGERISIRSSRDGKVYALTERQTARQTRGTWLPRKIRSADSRYIEHSDTISSPLITPSRVERPTRRVPSREERREVARAAAREARAGSLRPVPESQRSQHALEI